MRKEVVTRTKKELKESLLKAGVGTKAVKDGSKKVVKKELKALEGELKVVYHCYFEGEKQGEQLFLVDVDEVVKWLDEEELTTHGGNDSEPSELFELKEELVESIEAIIGCIAAAGTAAVLEAEHYDEGTKAFASNLMAYTLNMALREVKEAVEDAFSEE